MRGCRNPDCGNAGRGVRSVESGVTVASADEFTDVVRSSLDGESHGPSRTSLPTWDDRVDEFLSAVGDALQRHAPAAPSSAG